MWVCIKIVHTIFIITNWTVVVGAYDLAQNKFVHIFFNILNWIVVYGACEPASNFVNTLFWYNKLNSCLRYMWIRIKNCTYMFDLTNWMVVEGACDFASRLFIQFLTQLIE